MQRDAKFLGHVLVWQDDEVWRWAAADNPAPKNAVLGERLQTDEVIYILRGDGGQFVRGAVKG